MTGNRDILRYAKRELSWKRRIIDAYGSPVTDPFYPRSLLCYVEEKTAIVRDANRQERIARAIIYAVPPLDPPKENDYIYLPYGECVIIKVETNIRDGSTKEFLKIFVE
jgi:hypothetical protein